MRNFTRISFAFILALTVFTTKSFAQCSLTVKDTVTYSCTGTNDGIITFTVTNGTAPYKVNFNGSVTSGYSSNIIVISGQAAFKGYTFTITDANNCSKSGSVTVLTNTLPKARVALPTTICAGTTGSYALGANSIGSNTYSWTSSPTGFSSNSSDPSISNPYFTTTYTLTETNPNGCSASNSVTITVNYPPSVSIGATENVSCAQGDPISLSGSPSGGTFSGNGVSGNTFSPSSAGVGNWPISYYYLNTTTGCSNSATTYIQVVNVSNLSLTSPYSNVCIDASNFKLTGTPGGGSYIGDGITDSTFDPTVAGVGTHVISYYYTQGTGCSYYASVTIMVHALPVVKFPNNKLCLNNGSFALNATPSGAGGVYSGTGVSGQNFSPTAAGVGSNVITFVYTDVYGCSSSTYDTITVLQIPSVSLSSSVTNICLNGNSFNLTGGSPSGGTYSGNGVSSGIFNPANAGAGTQTIGYTVFGTNGCSNTATTNIKVNPLPIISFSNQTVCIGLGSLTLSASPSGGSFSGGGLLGLLGNTLNLITAGLGNHNITYTYTDGNGCTNSVTSTISIVAPTTVSVGTIPTVCANGSTINLASYGSPSGGTFTGTAVSNNVFNPTTAGAGTYTLTYTYTDGNGCTSTATGSITVKSPLSVSVSSLPTVCTNSGTVSLSSYGSPTGGTFSGTGVSSNVFNPATAGAGTFTLTYNYSSGNGCSNSAFGTITINAAPTALISTLPSVCANGSTINLASYGSPSGGTFTGTGVSNNVFNPSTAGAGTYTLTYTVTNSSGCTSSTTASITVNAAPTVSVSSVPSACVNGNTVSLSGYGSPSGGTFSGTAVSSNVFNPATAGTGTFTMTYSYSNTSGCSNTASASIVVNAAPSVSISSLPALCANGGTVSLSSYGSPSSGTFTGTGVSSNVFNPANSGAGTFTLTYTYSNSNGCSNSTTGNITVNAAPTVSISTLPSVCVNGSSINLSSYGSPSGGTFSGTGVSSNVFNPATSGAGTFTLTYTVSSNGCTSSSTASITVTATPTVSVSSIPSACVNGNSVSLSSYGSPSGGTFSGTGVSNNVFSPSTVGTYTLTYSYSNSNNCTNSSTGTITVNSLPTVSISSLPSACINGGSISLSSYGSPSGGTFSGTGVSNNTFNPATAGLGTYSITYTYSNASGCTNSTSTTITVTSGATASFSVNNTAQCLSGNSFSFKDMSSAASGSISSWTWTFGDNGTSTSQNPTHSYASAGSYNVSLTATAANGCAATATSSVTVNATPTVSVSTIPSVCSGGNSVSLSGYGSPSGGAFSGTGVTNNIFNPATAGVNTFTLTYTYSNGSGCTNSATGNITVNALPTVSINSIPSVCVNGSTVLLSNYGSPTGGTFSGTGVSNGVFNPATTGAGTFTITYTYKNTNGCTNSATTAITVVSAPTVSFSINDTEQCLSNNSFIFTDLSSTGSGSMSTWSWNFGDNSASSSQNPTHSYSSAGSYNVTLTATTTNGCSATATVAAIVDPQPAVSFATKGSVCLSNNSINFSDASTVSSGSIVGWSWNFGDGNGTSSLQNPNYVYSNTGTYTVSLTVTTNKGCTGTYSSTVTIYPSPVASFSSNVANQCVSSTPISLSDASTVSSGKISYWSWNFGNGTSSTSQSPNAVYSSAGTFNVTLVATTDNGCRDTANGQITIFALPAANPGSAQTICAGNSVNIGSTPVMGSSYTWGNSPAGTSSPDTTVTPYATTTYTLSETNSNGCSASNSVTIKVNALPAANTGSAQSICSGSSATIGASLVTGSKYSWTSDPSGFTSSSASATVSPSVITTYTLTEINSNSCVASNSVIITVNPLPAALAGSNQTISSGSSASIGGAAITGSMYSWTSNPSGFTSTISNPTVSPSTTTTYTVTEINADGCKSSNTVTITVTSSGSQPIVSVKGQTTFCAGGSVQLSTNNAPGYTFQWSNQNGNISGSTSPNYNATISGIYYVTVTSKIFSSSSWSWVTTSSTSAGVTVNVIPAPAAYAGSNQSICKGTSVTLGAAAVQGSKYKWSAPGAGNIILTNSKITVTPAGNTTYTLTETNSNGCSNSNQVTITVVPLPNVNLPHFQTVCSSGSTFTLSGGNPSGGTYYVDGASATTFNPANESIGSHTITYTYANSTGCFGTASQSITVTSVEAAPTISANGSTSFCNGGSVKLMASSYHVPGDVDYSWSNQNGPLMGPGSQSQSINVTSAGTYYATVSINGCNATSKGTAVTVTQAPVANAGSNVYYNYGYDNPPVLTGSANVSGASYKWSTGATTASITVYPTKTTTYWLTVTANGCTSQQSNVTVYVRDVRCQNNKDKNCNNECEMCHYDPTKKQWGHITVNKSDVPSHEKGGDKFDDCNDFGSDINASGTDVMNIYPNPFTSSTNVELNFANGGQVSVELWSMNGKLLKNIFSGNVESNTPYKYTIEAESMVPGIYIVRVVTIDHANYGKIELLR